MYTDDHIVSEGQYLEDIVGVISINDLMLRKAKQLRVKIGNTTFLNTGVGSPVKVPKGEWVSIYNYVLSEHAVYPIAISVVTNTGDTFDIDMCTLVLAFDYIGYDSEES